MEIRRTIRLPEWNEETAEKIKTYWRGRGVELRELDETRLQGRRGNLWGNLFSFHVAKVMMTVTVSRTEEGIECVLDVDPKYRSVTVLNRTYLELELAVMESFLLHDDLQPEAWAEHKREAGKVTAELAKQTFRHTYLRKGPQVIGGDLRAKAKMMLAFAIVMTPIVWIWGPLLAGLFHHDFRMPGFDRFVRFMFGPFMAILLGGIYGFIALWMFRIQRRSEKCVNALQAAEQLGVGADELARTILDRNVQPEFIKDGEPVYDMSDVTGAASLLRASASPQVEGLLRPLESSQSQIQSGESLLRPSVPNEAEEQAQQTIIR